MAADRDTTLRTPLAEVRGLGSARHGSGAWFTMRLTSLALFVLGLWFVTGVIGHVGATREEMQAWLGHPLNATLMILTLAVTFWHGAAGVREIAEDYVHEKLAKMGVIVAVNFVSVLLGAACIVSVLLIAFGAR